MPPEEHIKALFDSLPADPQERLTAVPVLYAAIRKEAAKALQPAVAQMVDQAAKAESFDKMTELSNVVSKALGDAQLAIRNPITGFPASLKAGRPRPSSPARYLRLQDRWRGPRGIQEAPRVDQLSPESVKNLELISTIADDELSRGEERERPSGHGR